MTALRLAEHVARTTDVDGMLDAMTPAQFYEWCAKDEIEPIGATDVLMRIAEMLLAVVGKREVEPGDVLRWLRESDDTVPTMTRQGFVAMFPGARTH